ncbi:MAG: metallophosphoesterase family protein [Deltaproteobacteria bacterium]|nr:metallophosphoesterase family protein [Deltaproteobacteria bacterium]
MPPARPARIGVVADTHAKPDPRALELLAARQPDVILHAGDIGDLAVLDALRPLAPTLVAVRGNIDAAVTGADALPERALVLCEREGREALRVLLLHIAVHGPRLRAEVRRLAERERADLVVCGHSHVPFAARERGLAVFNPGSIGPRRFSLPIVFGWLELGERLTLGHVDVTTGLPWRPPPAAGV